MEKFNEEALWSPGGEYSPMPAKDKLSTIIDTVITGIEVMTLMAKRWWLKLALGIVITALKSFRDQFCKPQN